MANSVQILGKIQRINTTENNKVCFITIREKRSRDEINYIDCVSFSPDFIKEHFSEGKWIYIQGHMKSSKYNGQYKQDIIVDDIFFAGDKIEPAEELPFP